MKYILLFIAAILGSIKMHAQPDSTKTHNYIVLLKNKQNLIPFKNLDSLFFSYSNAELKLLGSRYTQNRGANKVVITTDLLIDKDPQLKVLILIGDSVQLNQDQLEQFQVIVYTKSKETRTLDLITQKLFGGIAFTDTLSYAVYGYTKGAGVQTKGGLRFSFGQPSEVGMDSDFLNQKIDSIALMAIDSGVAPGIQVLVARNGKVVFHKTYGYLTYENKEPVEKELLYDFASVTKITGALPALMQLYDADKFSLDASMGTYLPYFAKGNKKDLQYRQILSHNAQLKAWIPYWKTTIKKNGKYKRNTLSHDSTTTYSVKIVDNLYLYNNYRNIIYKQIRKSPLRKEAGYKYSGLSFYLYPDIIEKITKQDYETYLKANVYQPLGASTVTYNPLRFYPLDKIVPTEIDTFFRMAPLRGTVHDEGAAMMKGVSSNAGLFGTTLDLAKIMQMYLWMGSYGGEQLISQNTMELFTACHYCNQGNRRGLGFDKPVLVDKENGSTAIDASAHSFGHSGYTGTFVWADPDNG
ncbi:MAG: serine hydrolase, partial [Cyclobacteriaceae bacterium]|nr:serine hydrolase [Cyclobacteriaceae bacterium]